MRFTYLLTYLHNWTDTVEYSCLGLSDTAVKNHDTLLKASPLQIESLREIEFRYGGRLFCKTGRSYILAVDWERPTVIKLDIERGPDLEETDVIESETGIGDIAVPIFDKYLSYGRETARSLIRFRLTPSVIRKIMHFCATLWGISGMRFIWTF